MARTLFFSWQSDTPGKLNRNFIEKALELAIVAALKNIEIDEPERDLTVDSDTRGVPGSPPIVETIFNKISSAAIFVPDMTFVGMRGGGRPVSNPNVLIEYGWALSKLSHRRIICVMNSAFGVPSVETLPFDMHQYRHPIQYLLPENADPEMRKAVRANLVKDLTKAITTIIALDEAEVSVAVSVQPKEFQRRKQAREPGRFRESGNEIGVVDGTPGFDDPIPDFKLLSGSPTWFRMMPMYDEGRKFSREETKAVASSIMPILGVHSGYGNVRGIDGYGLYGGGRDAGGTNSLTYVFNTGEIWTVDTRLIDNRNRIIPINEGDFVRVMGQCVAALKKAKLGLPYKWIAGMAGIKGRGIYLANFLSEIEGHCLEDVIEFEGIYEDGQDPTVLLEPFFERIYDACGVPRPKRVR